jgi:hypothetical protein
MSYMGHPSILNAQNYVCSGLTRAMALEMGSAAHEVFAAVRLWQVHHYQERSDLADFHGPRLFGDTRYQAMLEVSTKRG